MTTIVETVKVFGESFTTARTLISLLHFLSFSMSMDLGSDRIVSNSSVF